MPTLSHTLIAKTLHPIKKSCTVWLWSISSLSPFASCKFSISPFQSVYLGSERHSNLPEFPAAETIGNTPKKDLHG